MRQLSHLNSTVHQSVVRLDLNTKYCWQLYLSRRMCILLWLHVWSVLTLPTELSGSQVVYYWIIYCSHIIYTWVTDYTLQLYLNHIIHCRYISTTLYTALTVTDYIRHFIHCSHTLHSHSAVTDDLERLYKFCVKKILGLKFFFKRNVGSKIFFWSK